MSVLRVDERAGDPERDGSTSKGGYCQYLLHSQVIGSRAGGSDPWELEWANKQRKLDPAAVPYLLFLRVKLSWTHRLLTGWSVRESPILLL